MDFFPGVKFEALFEIQTYYMTENLKESIKSIIADVTTVTPEMIVTYVRRVRL